MRTALTTAIYRKSLRLSSAARSEMTVSRHRGQIYLESDLEFVKKFTRPNFHANECYTLKTRKTRLFLPAINSKNASLSVIWPIFLLKWNKMCKFFNSYEESLHLSVCKLAKYVWNCVVFCKIYTADKNFTQVCLE